MYVGWADKVYLLFSVVGKYKFWMFGFFFIGIYVEIWYYDGRLMNVIGYICEGIFVRVVLGG